MLYHCVIDISEAEIESVVRSRPRSSARAMQSHRWDRKRFECVNRSLRANSFDTGFYWGFAKARNEAGVMGGYGHKSLYCFCGHSGDYVK